MWRRDKEKNESEIEHFDISREFTPLTIVLAIALTMKSFLLLYYMLNIREGDSSPPVPIIPTISPNNCRGGKQANQTDEK